MADEPQSQETQEQDARKGGGRLPLWIGVIVAVEIVAALAVVNVVVPRVAPDNPQAWIERAEMIERDIPNVVVNLKDGNAKRLLRVHVTFRILAENPAKAQAAIQRPGVIEDRLINTLCQKRLSDVTGRQAEIKEEIVETLRRDVFTAAWRKENGEIRIEELLMPEFVIQ